MPWLEQGAKLPPSLGLHLVDLVSKPFGEGVVLDWIAGLGVVSETRRRMAWATKGQAYKAVFRLRYTIEVLQRRGFVSL
jgi:hypothetical protein